MNIRNLQVNGLYEKLKKVTKTPICSRKGLMYLLTLALVTGFVSGFTIVVYDKIRQMQHEQKLDQIFMEEYAREIVEELRQKEANKQFEMDETELAYKWIKC